jgi:hypothetical protein
MYLIASVTTGKTRSAGGVKSGMTACPGEVKDWCCKSAIIDAQPLSRRRLLFLQNGHKATAEKAQSTSPRWLACPRWLLHPAALGAALGQG